ncbi:MAG: hypothetical protein P8R42_05775 [Candidatus Binatia bacterium]|nr:hypothetical protein [Candidatus Binatia bacterium]
MGSRTRPAPWVVGLLLLATALRVSSFEWNERLQGDVSLFALTTRNFVQTGELRYPMKYEFSDQVDYCETQSVASMHPPLFPLAAGAVGRAIGTDDTFPLLKLLSAIGGAALLLLLALRTRTTVDHGAMVALAFVCASPSLVDFSANGSPYIWSGLFLLLATILIGRIPNTRKADFALAGALAALGPQIHSALASIPVAFVVVGALEWRRVSLRDASIFFGVAALLAAPYFTWNLVNFGSPLYSYSPHVLWTNLGFAQEGIWGNVITWRWLDAPRDGASAVTLRTIAESTGETLVGLFRDGGPGALALAAAGLIVLFRHNARGLAYRFVPLALYLGLVLPFFFRDRFVVPLLPLTYVVAGIGFAAGWASKQRLLAGACAAIALAWMVPAYFESPPTRYYLNDAPHSEAYEAMLPIARRLALLPTGTTLGYSNTLAGGIEAVYHHRQPFVRGRSHSSPREEHPGDVLRKLGRDFQVRYVWADAFTKGEVQEIFPNATEVLGNGAFFVLELPPEARTGSVCAPEQDRLLSP